MGHVAYLREAYNSEAVFVFSSAVSEFGTGERRKEPEKSAPFHMSKSAFFSALISAIFGVGDARVSRKAGFTRTPTGTGPPSIKIQSWPGGWVCEARTPPSPLSEAPNKSSRRTQLTVMKRG